MEYECQLASIDKTIVISEGILEPLCNSCTSPDCTNPIRDKVVSVLGIPKKMRYYIEHESVIKQVVSCKGYVGDVTRSMDNAPRTA